MYLVHRPTICSILHGMYMALFNCIHDTRRRLHEMPSRAVCGLRGHLTVGYPPGRQSSLLSTATSQTKTPTQIHLLFTIKFSLGKLLGRVNLFIIYTATPDHDTYKNPMVVYKAYITYTYYINLPQNCPQSFFTTSDQVGPIGVLI